ncbi:uncharacterized protein LOC135384733 [Ornithodoros turicata]|uniref:uncharacterized protein LOC135384733 n=1 Tax=Ornithodoros turicata TaxID=34597 RepID=UPI0031387224
MDLKKLVKADLLLLCEELGVDTDGAQRKPCIIAPIKESGADDDEIAECWELVKEQKSEKSRKIEAEAQERQRERELECRRLELEKEIELKKLELEMKRLEGRPASETGCYDRDRIKMSKLLQPYKMGEDIGLFLVNFERTCEKVRIAKDLWPSRLLTVLPCEAADVIARLSAEDADDYDKVKDSLLRKYRLSIEAFRQRFRASVLEKGQSYSEFAYGLKANMSEWLKRAKAFGNHDKVVECFYLEQFYQGIPEDVRYWVQDREESKTLEKAAELAQEYAMRREARGYGKLYHGSRESLKKGPEENSRFRKMRMNNPKEMGPSEQREETIPKTADEGPINGETERRGTHRELERRRPLVCHRCKRPGHIAARCRNRAVAFSYVTDDDENLRLLRPYLFELEVNDKPCRALRDSAATMDIVHPSYINREHLTGDVAWIKQVVEEESVCLPVAAVTINGPFGEIRTEAAVSDNLSTTRICFQIALRNSCVREA